MKDQIVTIKRLIEELIQRNETLINENELLKSKIKDLEESAVDMSDSSDSRNDAIDRSVLKQKMEQYITELDKCINTTQTLIERSNE